MLKDKDSSRWIVTEIKLCRMVLCATQQQIADALGVSVQTVKRLEKPDADPRLKTIISLRKLYAALGVKFELSDEGTMAFKLSTEVTDNIAEGKLAKETASRLRYLTLDRC